MAKYTKQIDDAVTGEVLIVELNAEEAAERDAEIAANIAAKSARIADAQAKREAALAKLAALGLEPDDLKALGL